MNGDTIDYHLAQIHTQPTDRLPVYAGSNL